MGGGPRQFPDVLYANSCVRSLVYVETRMQSPRHATEVGDSVHEGLSHRQGGKLDCLQFHDDHCDSGLDMVCGRMVDPTVGR